MKARGAMANPPNRFHASWSELDPAQLPDTVATEVFAEQANRIISTNRSPDVPFDQSVNPYRGCEHGCIYCYARPSHAFLDLSPGLDFESRLFAKTNAAERLRAELSRPGYRCRLLALGANTDPYQPLEKGLELTRGILEVCLEFRQPVAIVTKGSLVCRDLDLLEELARRRLTQVTVSLTTLSRDLKRRMEPRAASPEARLRTIETLSNAGVPVSTLIAPLIPRINDHEIEALVKAAADAGVQSAGYVLLRLPHEVKTLFRDWLTEHFPDRAEAVINLVRNTRGGKDYDSGFGQRMRGSGQYAAMIRARFEAALRRFGLGHRDPQLDTSQFRVPREISPQLDLF